MTVCAMFGCKNRMHKGCGKHFFRFPLKDPERLIRWIEAVQRDDWKPSVHSKVCSDHFTEKDYMLRPGAACPYLRTDAVPTPLFIQRKKKTKKRKYTKKPASVTPAPTDEEGCAQGLVVHSQEPGEDLITSDEAHPNQEPPIPDHTLSVDPQSQDRGAELPSAEIDRIQEKREEPQSQAEQIEIWAGKQGVESRLEPPPCIRMTDIDTNITTQNERQVALILAELEDTHCEMRAAEARAAREAAGSGNQSTSDNEADCALSEADSTNNQDNMTDFSITFDHAYTSLTIGDKENNVPPPSPTTASTTIPGPSPIANPRVIKLRKKIKTLQKQVLRQGVKIKSLKQTLVDLRRNSQSERDPEKLISEHCNGLALALFTNQLKNHRRYSSMQYCNLLKDFALNLYHSSPKAYKFCRLFLSLPHPVSLRHWKTAGDTSQGALEEMIVGEGQSEEPQGELSQEDILAGAFQAVVLESASSEVEALQNVEPPGAQTL